MERKLTFGYLKHLIIENSEENLDELRRRLKEDDILPLIKDNYGWGLLHYAALFSKVQAVRMLIRFGCRVDHLGPSLRTPLMLAVFHEQNFKVIECLLEAGADAEIKDMFGCSCLKIVFNPAFKNRCITAAFLHELLRVKTAEYVVDKILRVHRSTLSQAALSKSMDVMRFMIARGLSIYSRKLTIHSRGDEQMTSLHVAIEQDDIALARKLIENGADAQAICNYGSTVYMVTLRANVEMVQLMINHGANVNYGFGTYKPLFYSLIHQQFESDDIAPIDIKDIKRERRFVEISCLLLLNQAELPGVINDSFTIFDLALLNENGPKRVKGLVAHLALLDKSGQSITESYLRILQRKGNKKKWICVEKYYKQCLRVLDKRMYREITLITLLTMGIPDFGKLVRRATFISRLDEMRVNVKLIDRFVYFDQVFLKRIAFVTNM